jgi:hypothetical protein
MAQATSSSMKVKEICQRMCSLGGLGSSIVTDKNHNAPVMLLSPDAAGPSWGMGEYWSRIGGKWYVVKRPE